MGRAEGLTSQSYTCSAPWATHVHSAGTRYVPRRTLGQPNSCSVPGSTLKSPCASQGMPSESTMSPKAAKMSRSMPLGPRAPCRYSEHARSCRPDAVDT
eukprot:2616890-Pyramimonas_sp.AAC.1